MKKNQTAEYPSFLGSGQRTPERYAVILAGGEGSRLKSLTRTIAGDERPKQFCAILDSQTLLDITRNRTALKLKPENTFYSLTRKHEHFYQSLLKEVPGERLIVQPENKGTAPAILYSLLKLPPEAFVAFFPSDHYFSDDRAFMDNVETAYQAAEMNCSKIVLLGIEPEKAETSYGWIEPVESLFGNLSSAVSQVKRFWEKPSTQAARYLLGKGCLWNSFVMVGKVESFLNLYRKRLPDLYRMFIKSSVSFGRPGESEAMRAIYHSIGEVNFSSQILEKSAGELYVLRVGNVSWSDWGEPQRVLLTLKTLGVQTDWMACAG